MEQELKDIAYNIAIDRYSGIYYVNLQTQTFQEIWVSDAMYGLVTGNNLYKDTLLRYAEFIVLEDRQRILDWVEPEELKKNLLGNEGRISTEYAIVYPKNSEIQYIRVEVENVTVVDGQPESIIALFSNITKEKKEELIMQDILLDVNTGVWQIELSDGEEPKMFGNACMDRLVGIQGIVSPEYYYRQWYDNIVDSYYDDVAESVSEMLAGKPSEVEYLFEHPQHGLIYIRCGGSLSKVQNEKQIIQGYHQDVTELYSLKKTVKNNEGIFSSLSNGYNVVFSVDLLANTYMVLKDDLDHDQIKCTDSYDKLQEEIAHHLIHEDDRVKLLETGSIQNLQNTIEAKKPYIELTCRMRNQDGIYRFMRLSYIFVEEQLGKTSKVLYVFADINEEYQRMLEADLRDKVFTASADITYQTIFRINLSQNQFLVMKRDTTVSDITPYQHDYRKMVREVCKFVYPADRELFVSNFSAKNIVKELKKRQREKEFKYRRLSLDGTYRWKDAHFVYIDQEWSADVIVVCLVRDIDSWKSQEVQSKQLLEEALKHANNASNAKTEFLSRMSHDIRTPLNAIIGMTTLAEIQLDNTKKVKECLEKIDISGKFLLNLVNEVLDMNRIESGKIDLNEEQFTLAEMMGEVLSVIQPMAIRKKQQFVVLAQEIEHEVIIADKHRFSQIVINLASNAIKYTPNEGFVKINLKEEPLSIPGYANYILIIEDSGIGMTEEFISRIFEPFTRAEDSRVSKAQGTGLGMSIVKNIIDMMGGNISIESKIGIGSKFIVELPIQFKSKAPSLLAEFDSLSVLVADSDIDTCHTACQILEDLGISSDYALNEEAVIEKIKNTYALQQNYYAIIIDWQMLYTNGVNIIKGIREIVKGEIPIIVSAYDSSVIEEDIINYGIRGVIFKPLFKSQLVFELSKIKQKAAHTLSKESLFDISFEGKKVLMVEDNEINSEMLYDILSMVDLQIDTAVNGKEAISLFCDSPEGYYDMILMDIQMPILNGLEATKIIRGMARKDAQTIPIIAMTANAFAEDIHNSKKAGMNEHIAKPLEIELLMKRLKFYMTK